ncbi:unnamed protein product [Protopolystoma xenopodis]|uniref:Uncharacterized protein n=1 Tax=Protopolystoma xenopodis TaxID=117903 RepID=A0A3S5CP30_9PLAT|nr:unnamed protein product [Protopolystoma xenopodis]
MSTFQKSLSTSTWYPGRIVALRIFAVSMLLATWFGSIMTKPCRSSVEKSLFGKFKSKGVIQDHLLYPFSEAKTTQINRATPS